MEKKRKFTILELIVIVVILSVLALFASPKIFNSPKQLKEATVIANVDIAVSKITGIFALKSTENATTIAETAANMLNKTTKNPMVKNTDAFTVNFAAKGAVNLVTDDENNTITINGYGQNIKNPLKTKVIKSPIY